MSAVAASYDQKDAGNRTVNYTGVALSGTEAANYSIATTATGAGVISRKALELVADSVTIQEGEKKPMTFTGSIIGFVAGDSIGSSDTLLFSLADPTVTAAGSYAVNGTLNGSASGNYGQNYTFSNAASNANAFVITARPATIAEMTMSDLIPGLKGTEAGNIKITELDNAIAQATPKVTEAGIDFAIAQTILPVDEDGSVSIENNGMKQPPAMTPQEVAEQVSAQQGGGDFPASQVNKNGAASNAGDTGMLNADVDMVQQMDNAVGTEESKKTKGAA